jgi:hypothetical protein
VAATLVPVKQTSSLVSLPDVGTVAEQIGTGTGIRYRYRQHMRRHMFTRPACFVNSKIGIFSNILIRVSDPYSFFTDPDPEDPDGGQYGSGSGFNPDPGL